MNSTMQVYIVGNKCVNVSPLSPEVANIRLQDALYIVLFM